MRRGWWQAADGLLALAVCAIGLVGTANLGPRGSAIAPDRTAYALVVIAALALAGRRLAPLVTLAVTTLATSTYLVLGYPYGPILLSVLIAVYTVARHLPVRRAVVAGALALPVLLVHVLVAADDPLGIAGVIPGSAWVVVPFAVGSTVRLIRESAERTRADDQRRHADELRRRADEERLRVAQEVHDVVGHGLAAINMQAEIALHLLAKRPEQAEAALTAISRTSREALDELRVTLDLVRRDAAGDLRTPTPGLARLDDLVARMSDAGVPVSVHADGGHRDLPAAVDLTAYRVVQEALTNVLRHAGPAPATVRLTYRPRELVVEVTDAGPPGLSGLSGPPGLSGPSGARPAGAGAGHGIAGMRERVAALGGGFEAGPRPGGGFRVYASLPLPGLPDTTGGAGS